MENPEILYFVALLNILLGRVAESATTVSIPAGCFSKIYAFGDSFTDTGNTRNATGPNAFHGVSNLPYGETYFHRPTNRYSDGRLVVDFVAQALGLPMLQPYLNRSGDFSHGVNFAVAGSTVLDHEFFAQRNIISDRTPESLSTQLQWFSQFVDAQCNITVGQKACKDIGHGEALYWIGEIGVNDYAYTLDSAISRRTIRTLTIAKTVKFLETLIQRGARYMLVQGIPLVGCLPKAMTYGSPADRDRFGCIKTENEVIHLHNYVLQKELEILRQKYRDALIVYADYAGAHSQVLQNPRVYGFENTVGACCGAGGGQYNFNMSATCGGGVGSVINGEKATSCGDPAKYVNWDGLHFTDAVNGVFANMFLRGAFTSPPFNRLLHEKKECLRT